MHFCKDSEHDGWFWVDTGSDSKADHFRPCGPCTTGLVVVELEGRIWNEFNLCGYCNTLLEIVGSIQEASGQRPYIMDRQPMIIQDEDSLSGLTREKEQQDPYYMGNGLEDLFPLP